MYDIDSLSLTLQTINVYYLFYLFVLFHVFLYLLNHMYDDILHFL